MAILNPKSALHQGVNAAYSLNTILVYYLLYRSYKQNIQNMLLPALLLQMTKHIAKLFDEQRAKNFEKDS